MLKNCFCGVAVEAGWKRWRRLTSGQGGIGGNIAAAAAAAAAAAVAAVEQRALFQKNKLPGRVENLYRLVRGVWRQWREVLIPQSGFIHEVSTGGLTPAWSPEIQL